MLYFTVSSHLSSQLAHAQIRLLFGMKFHSDELNIAEDRGGRM